MPLIDRTYFVGELNIPDTHKDAVIERLDYFIEKYEDRFLKMALPYDLYDDYRNGDIDEDIYFGSEYTSGRRWLRWDGLIVAPTGSTPSVSSANTFEVIVGRGNQYDPLPDERSVIIPPAFVGQVFTISRRGPGQLRSDEYAVSGNVFSLVEPDRFNAEETFFYNKTASVVFTGPTVQNPMSPIANYIYYWWMRDNWTKTAGQGEVKPKGENSTSVNNGAKMTRAWNEMVEQVHGLRQFLEANRLVSGSSLVIASNTYRGHNHRLPEVFEYINPLI